MIIFILFLALLILLGVVAISAAHKASLRLYYDGGYNFEQDCTICIKTFLRPKCIQRLIHSIRSKYPNIKILVADDGDENIESIDENMRWLHLPFNVGISSGRNAMLAELTTPYFVLMDDDMIVDDNTDLAIFYRLMKQNPTADIIGGKVAGIQGLYGVIFEYGANETVQCKPHEFTHTGSHLMKTHRVLNFFIAKTDVIRELQWDPQLKTQEHTEFFYRAWLKGLHVIATDLVEIAHDGKCFDREGAEGRKYLSYRNKMSDDEWSRYMSEKTGKSWP